MGSPFYEEFGRLLRRAREGQGLTQAQVADRVSLSRTSITNIESGNQPVQLMTVYELAAAVGVAPAHILPARSVESLDESNMLDGLPDDARSDVEMFVSKSRRA